MKRSRTVMGHVAGILIISVSNNPRIAKVV